MPMRLTTLTGITINTENIWNSQKTANLHGKSAHYSQLQYRTLATIVILPIETRTLVN